MATWPDSSKKAPNVFLNTIDDIPGSNQSGFLDGGPPVSVKPPPLPPPVRTTLLPFVVDNAPGFLNENVTIHPFTLTSELIGANFTNPDITIHPFTMSVGLSNSNFTNPDITIFTFVVDNASGFLNTTVTEIPVTLEIPIPPTILPFTVNNAPAFVDSNITTIPVNVNNAPAFTNVNVTTFPVTMTNAKGFLNDNITTLSAINVNNAPGLTNSITLPFVVNSGVIVATDPLWANVVYLTNTGAVTDISPYHGPIQNTGTTSSTLNSPPNGSWISFNGTTNYYYFFNLSPTTIISEDFTVDGWIRKNSAVDGWIWSQYVSSGGEFFGRTIWYTTSTGIIAFQRGSNFVESAAGVIQPNTTYFVELTRVGGNVRIFVNGNVVATLAITGNLGNIGTAFGNAVGGTGGAPWNGFMSPMRITKGVGRNTANYTPPAPGPFPTTGP